MQIKTVFFHTCLRALHTTIAAEEQMNKTLEVLTNVEVKCLVLF